MLELANVGSKDTVYHLGCSRGEALRCAYDEFGVRNTVGIEIDGPKAAEATKSADSMEGNHKIVCGDIRDADISDADVVLFWFADEEVVAHMTEKFSTLRKGARVITVWSPPTGCLPERVDFPFVLSVAPFRRATDIKEQLLAVMDVKCIDFVTAWEFSERYTRALGDEDAGKNRFLTIIQAVTMWINARNLGITCTKEMPESIRTYVGILRTFFGINVEHLLKKDTDAS